MEVPRRQFLHLTVSTATLLAISQIAMAQTMVVGRICFGEGGLARRPADDAGSREVQMTKPQRQAIVVVALCVLGALLLLYGFWTHGWFAD
jgi:hypothetical protein